jgi:hypothetical protein
LTALALVVLAVIAVDVSAGFHASHPLIGASVYTWVHNALAASVAWVSHLGVLDWILVGASVFLVAWGWVRAVAFARMGTIQIADLTCDDSGLGPAAAKAALQQELGRRGLLPPSGVPGGSPSVAGIADAISKSPVPQANWLGALIGIIPWPPASTSFKISGTLLKSVDAGQACVQFAYELVCAGPRPGVQLGIAEGADAKAAIAQAGADIYRRIGQAAPDIYPTWARWRNSAALVTYRGGIDLEKEADTRGYEQAYKQFVEASAEDPENMLAQLRAANCLERMASGTTDAADKLALQVQALAAYTAVRIRRPDIFQAGFRASVLMSILASTPVESLQESEQLRSTLSRFERATARHIDPHDAPDGHLQTPGSNDRPLTQRLETAALKEARRVRHGLRPLRTIVHEKRFRHRFEPSGRERRQMRKALGVSKMAQKARREQRRQPTPAGEDAGLAGRLTAALARVPSEARQLWWRAIVDGRYLRGRWHVAGWQAHYNAACFYALLPRASRTTRWWGGGRVRRRALEHLARAVDQAGAALNPSYVRDEDPDLEVLRELNPQRFAMVLGHLGPDELVIRYRANGADSRWGLRVWGEATASPTRAAAPVLAPIRCTGNQLVFRVKLVNEHRGVCFLLYRKGRAIATDPGWEVAPEGLITPEVRVDLTYRTIVDAEQQPVAARQLRGTGSADGDHRPRRARRGERRGPGGARPVDDTETDDVGARRRGPSAGDRPVPQAPTGA